MNQEAENNERITFRLSPELRQQAQTIIERFPDKYHNISHFARVGFFRQLREEEKDIALMEEAKNLIKKINNRTKQQELRGVE